MVYDELVTLVCTFDCDVSWINKHKDKQQL